MITEDIQKRWGGTCPKNMSLESFQIASQDIEYLLSVVDDSREMERDLKDMLSQIENEPEENGEPSESVQLGRFQVVDEINRIIRTGNTERAVRRSDLAFLCACCGGFGYVPIESIDTGTILACDTCGGKTVVSLQSVKEYTGKKYEIRERMCMDALKNAYHALKNHSMAVTPTCCGIRDRTINEMRKMLGEYNESVEKTG